MNTSKETNRTLIFIMSKASVQGRSGIWISFNITASCNWGTWCFFRTRYLSPRHLYTIVFFIRGNFDRLRYFALSLAFIDVMRGFTAIVIGVGLSCSIGFSCQLDYQKLHPTLQSSTDVFSTFFLAGDMYFRTFSPLTHKWRCARCYIDNLDYFHDINRFLSFCIRWLI